MMIIFRHAKTIFRFDLVDKVRSLLHLDVTFAVLIVAFRPPVRLAHGLYATRYRHNLEEVRG